MSETAVPVRTVPPAWAVQRVSTVIESHAGLLGNDPKIIAQKAGLSKSLTRSCMFYIARGR